MKRDLIEVADIVAGPVKDPQPGEALLAWLLEQALAYRLDYLLAHADDGVIWGKVVDHHLVVSSEVAPKISPALQWETLQTARLFGQPGELLGWRDPDHGWQTRLI